MTFSEKQNPNQNPNIVTVQPWREQMNILGSVHLLGCSVQHRQER